MHAERVQHGDRGQRVRSGLAAARVDGVRPASAGVCVRMPAIAGRGDCEVGQRHGRQGVERCVKSHAPGVAVGAATHASQLPADLQQEVVQACRHERVGHLIHREALGDAGQIELKATGLRDAPVDRIEGEPLPAGACARGVQCRRRRRAMVAVCFGLRTEPPQRDQRADRRVDGATACLGPMQRTGQDFREGGGQGVTGAGFGRVVAADVRCRLPGAHLRDHPVERTGHSGADRIVRLQRRVVEPERPGGPHGAPRQRLEAGGVGHAWRCRVRVAAGVPGGKGGTHRRAHRCWAQGITSTVAA